MGEGGMSKMIGGQFVQVLRVGHLREILLNDSLTLCFMKWSDARDAWEFTEANTAHGLKTHEAELSDFIIQNERKE